jgi:hypothetical protein
MLHLACHLFPWKEATLMCMESSKRIRLLHLTIDYLYQKHFDYLGYFNHLDYLSYVQKRALLDTLRKFHTYGGAGHIAVFNALAIGHTKHSGRQRVSSFPFAMKKLRASNRQDFVFIRPPGISHGAFQLRMDNVWFCKVLLMFEIESKSDICFERN